MAVKTALWKKLLMWLVILIALLLVGSLALLRFSGAWSVFFPSSEHDTVAPRLPLEMGSPAVLVFSKTNSFRHIDGIEGGTRALKALSDANGWEVFMTENGAVFNEQDLARFDSVVFLNASGDMLSVDQEQVFQSWLEAGGGWVGIHAAGDGSHAAWGWYMDNLIGAKFTAHIMGPQFQQATVVMESPKHPVVQRLPNIWKHTEEWYSWEVSPRANNFDVLAVLDEDSYSPVQKMMGNERDLSMGDHPVVWTNCVGEGRSLYSALGHTAEAFDQAEHRILLEDALRWVMGLKEGGCPMGATP
ncbi:MAG: ThuA domain-containing protein [Halioglobus sp.]